MTVVLAPVGGDGTEALAHLQAWSAARYIRPFIWMDGTGGRARR